MGDTVDWSEYSFFAADLIFLASLRFDCFLAASFRTYVFFGKELLLKTFIRTRTLVLVYDL